MNTQTYSRDALRAMPAIMRKQHLAQYIHSQGYINTILGAARNGETNVLIPSYDASAKTGSIRSHQFNWQQPPTAEELREALLEIFPDCTITYEEKWVQTAPGKQELKKGLTVDWS